MRVQVPLWNKTVFRVAPGGDLSALMDVAAYLAVAVGYLFGVIAAPHLTLPGFLLFTALNLAWVGTFWYISSGSCPADRLAIPLLLMGALSIAVEFSAWTGMAFDWLLPVVFISVLSLAMGWRAGLGVSAILYAATAVAAAGMGCNCAGQQANLLVRAFNGFPSTLSLLPAYAFVVIFSVVMQRQQLLRERAEDLATEVSRSKAELEQANAQLREFSAQVEELAITQERNRMAREIHDTLGHYLTILAVKLETSAKLEERGDPSLQAELMEARRLAADCLSEVRHSVAALRPAELSRASFADALRRLVAEFESVAPVDVTLDLEGSEADLSPELRVTLYRCAQEALTNVRKHAAASKVLLRARMEPESVELTVLDNGMGAREQGGVDGAQGHAPGYGLLGMRERVALLGGTIEAGPEPQHGWRVEVRVPRHSAPASAADASTRPLAAAAEGAVQTQ